MRTRMTLVALTLLALSPLLTNAQAAPKKHYDDRTVLEAVRPALEKGTKVPLRLPTYFSTEGEDQLYAQVESATAKAYSVLIDFDPECHGSTACHFGEISGKAIANGARPPRGKPVKLAKKTTGYFVDGPCGASCSDSTLTWDEGGYRYTVAEKAG